MSNHDVARDGGIVVRQDSNRGESRISRDGSYEPDRAAWSAPVARADEQVQPRTTESGSSPAELGAVSGSAAAEPVAVPVAVIDIYLDSRFALHVRIDGVFLAPIHVRDDRGESADRGYIALRRDLMNRLHGLSGMSDSSTCKMPTYRREVRRVGRILGGILFGYGVHEDEFAIGGCWRNELDRALGILHSRAHGSGGFIAITFAAENPLWDSMPWELAIWRSGGRDIPIGVAEHIAFSRQVRHQSYPGGHLARSSRPCGRPRGGPDKVTLFHLSSDAAEIDRVIGERSEVQDSGQESMDRWIQGPSIRDFLARLESRHADQISEARASSTTEWKGWRSRRADIFQYFGHGNEKSRINWNLADQSSGREQQMEPDDLLDLLGRDGWPRLFVLLSCYSFGFLEQLLRKGSPEVMAGVGVLGEWMLVPQQDVQFLRVFYTFLFDRRERIDVAVQNTRRVLYRQEMERALGHESRVPQNWYKLTVLLRDDASARCFDGLAARRQDDRIVESVRSGGESDFPLHDPERERITGTLRRIDAITLPDTFAGLQQQAPEIIERLSALDLPDDHDLAQAVSELVVRLKSLESKTASPLAPADLDACHQIWDAVQLAASAVALEHDMSIHDIEKVIEKSRRRSNNRIDKQSRRKK